RRPCESSESRSDVGRVMLGFGRDIGQPPYVRRVEVAAHGLARLHVEQRRSVPPVERRAAARGSNARPDRIDARLEAELGTEELDATPARLQVHQDAVEARGLLAIERAPVA